jgi:serpin B
MMKKIIAVILSAIMIMLCGCGITHGVTNDHNTSRTETVQDLKAGKAKDNLTGKIDTDKVLEDAADIPADFAVKLLKSAIAKSINPKGNTLLSPVSVIYALAMTQNGACEETLAQMEKVLGMTREELNAWCYAYALILANNGPNSTLKLADSVWINSSENMTVGEDFIDAVVNYYNGDIYRTQFSDTTRDVINKWISDATDGMIEKVIDTVPPDAIMYLVNALLFESKWMDQYNDGQVRDHKFTDSSGNTKKTDFMFSSENYYLHDANAKGFMKLYEDGRFAFLALLPNEDLTVNEYLNTLTGKHLYDLIMNPETKYIVDAALPKFSANYSTELSEVLGYMGMTDAFDRVKANFSDMAVLDDGSNVYISRVLHKTRIDVTQAGTKAAAVTVVEMMKATGIMPVVKEHVKVTLDRPFIYMIVDCVNGVPLFTGTCMNV